MSDFGSLRPPPPPSSGANLYRSSSPIGTRPDNVMNPHSRYSLGKGAPTEHMMRNAQQSGGNLDSNTRNASMGSSNMSISGAPASRNLRPSSEMLPTMNHQANPETEAIDRWFEDLQHYEATLEEMATAALDQNFKEELSAIEQWFRVLSEAERTAALYSLLQESTQVQIRFFITVLQQMSRSDPNAALLSPSHQSTSMADQMEAKLASLGLKSPSGAGASSMKPPPARGYRQSSDSAGFLSPNVAASYNSGNSEAASTLAAQRAKLKANRTSAPGTLLGDNRAFSGGHLDQVQERGGSPNPQQQRGFASEQSRPQSTDFSNSLGRSPRASGPLDDQLSPITNTGNWSSMVNTPLAPMFSDNDRLGHSDGNVNLDSAAAQLAGLAHHHHANSNNNARTLVDPDAPRFRRKSNQNGSGYSQGQSGQMMYDQPSPGVSPNMGGQSAGWGQNDQYGRSGLNPPSSGFGGSNNFNMPPLSPNALGGGQFNLQMMNTMAAMGGLNLNNMNAAQFLAMQQQILQNQQSLTVLAAQQQQQQQMQQQQQQQGRNLRMGGGALSPGLGGASGLKSPRMGTSPSGRPAGMSSASPSGGISGNNSGIPGGEEEVADLSTLNDVAAWLRQLRLHKYTTNFEHSHWKDMVLMDDAKLQDMGVAALGARRKMLKTFELVRKKYGIQMEGEDEPGSGVPGATSAEEKAAESDDIPDV